jgi:chemotaxis protein MotB
MSGGGDGGHGGGHDDEPHEEHEEHVNHEAWVIPYADLLTLLMAMFIALYAMGTVDKDKFKELSLGFNEALGGPELKTGVFAPQEGDAVVAGTGKSSNGNQDSEGGSVGPGAEPDGRTIESLLQQQENIDAAKASEREALDDLKERLEGAAGERGLGDKLDFELRDDGLHVTIVTDEVLFDSGSAQIQPEGADILSIVAEALFDVTNPIKIGGHTDNIPIATEQYPSNWELSSARAAAVVRFLQEHGLVEHELLATGYADTKPVASNDTAGGRARNRRVEIVIESQVVDALLDANGLTNDPTTDDQNPPDDPIGGVKSIEDIVGELGEIVE